MHSKDELIGMIDKYISGLQFPRQPGHLYAPIIYSLEDGGKRIRPLMLLMACDMFSDQVEKALPAAAAIEMFHNFTLLHDDIMDNADLRRGKDAVHRKWGRNAAILSGDAMVIFSYKLLQDTPADVLPDVLSEFSGMALQVCEGQQYDMDFEKRDDVTINEYINMIRLKTAVLFAGSAKLGAMIAGASEADCQALYDFGINTGLAYQVQDDYLDTYGTEEVLGKPIGGDIEESKKTFLAINALNEAGAATRRALIATFTENIPLSQKVSRVRTIYNSMDIPELTKGTVSKYIDAAGECLDKISGDESRVAGLRRMLDILRNRNS